MKPAKNGNLKTLRKFRKTNQSEIINMDTQFVPWDQKMKRKLYYLTLTIKLFFPLLLCKDVHF